MRILLLILFVATIAQSQTPSTDVRVKLLLVDNQTTFRTGEPIRLVMEFTSDVPGYTVDTIPDSGGPFSETISVSPDAGVNHWYDEMTRGYQYPRDVFSSQKISATPTRLPITLNNTLRFDQPGRYTVKITTRRVSRNIVLTTNEVSFDVVNMSEEEEQAEVKRISALLDVKRVSQTDTTAVQELAFLTGDASTREKVRRFLNPNIGGSYEGSNIYIGLFIARNRGLALKLLENGMRDVNQPVNSWLLTTVSFLYFLQEQRGVPIDPKASYGWPTAESNSRFAAIQNSYLAELALGLSKRRGQSLSTTALTILTMAPKNSDRATLVAEARRVVVQQFSALDRAAQEQLLRTFWNDIRDPALLGPLKQILSDTSASARGIHQGALNRLIELDSDEARPFVIEQICDQQSVVDREVLGRLSDKSMWEVDRCLVGQMRHMQGMIDSSVRMVLERKPMLLARYATADIYRDVLDIYQESNSKFPPETNAAILAYLAKQNEAVTIPLIEQWLEKITPNSEDNFLPKLTKLYYSEAIGKILKQRLELDDPFAVSTAAYLLGKYGSPKDEDALLTRLARWQNDWRARVAEANTNFQGIAERELVDALVRGKAFGLSPERKQELRRNCLSEHCKQSNPQFLPER
ncbi:MAG TPA: hypothetical protein VFI24_28370 [Pyrinomonadaceae bacterium]|nr:hypothetical protein [Pyrinomonadaceae bacterium]